MIDVKSGLRKAYFDLLSGQLTYNGVQVPVSDDMVGPTAPGSLYVILAAQDGIDAPYFSGFSSWERINIDIISKTTVRASKQPLDMVAAQIFALVCPTPEMHGLADQPGMQINAVRFESDKYLSLTVNSSNTVERRILTFKQFIAQT